MVLLNNKLKHLSCTDFRIFLKKLVKDKIENSSDGYIYFDEFICIWVRPEKVYQ